MSTTRRTPRTTFDPWHFDGVPPHLADALIERIGADWLRTVLPTPILAERVVGQCRPAHLGELAQNPALTRQQRLTLNQRLLRLAESAAGAAERTAEDPILLAALLTTLRHSPTDHELRHGLARSRFAPALVEAALASVPPPAHRYNSRQPTAPSHPGIALRYLLHTGDPRIARHVLDLPGPLATDGEQARAALLLLEHGRVAELRELLDHPHPRHNSRAPRRRVRRLLRRAFPYGAAAAGDPAGPDDPRLAPLRALAEQHASPEAFTTLLHRYPNHPERALAALPRPSEAELIRRHHRAPLPPAARLALLDRASPLPDTARAFLDFRSTPDAMEAVQDIAATAVRRGVLDFPDLVRHLAPARVLVELELANPSTGNSSWRRRIASRQSAGVTVPTDIEPWNRTEYPRFEAALRELLATASAGQLLHAGVRAPSFPGALPELLADSPSGAAPTPPARPLSPTQRRHLNFLLAHAPEPTVRQAVAVLPAAEAEPLARISAEWIGARYSGSRADEKLPLGVFEAVLETCADPKVGAALLSDIRLSRGKVFAPRSQLLRCLIRHGVPGAASATVRATVDRETVVLAVEALGADIIPRGHSAGMPVPSTRNGNFSGLSHLALELAVASPVLHRPDRRTLLRRVLAAECLTQPAIMFVLRALTDQQDLEAIGLLAAGADFELAREATAAVLACPDPELRAGILASHIAGQHGELPRAKATLDELRGSDPPLYLTEDCALPWPEIIELYGRGEHLPTEAAGRILRTPDFPDGLAIPLLDAHPELPIQNVQYGWSPAVVKAMIRRGGRQHAASWIIGWAASGALEPEELMHVRTTPAKDLLDNLRVRGDLHEQGFYATVLARCAALLKESEDPVEAWVVAVRLLRGFRGTLAEWASTAAAVATAGIHGEPGAPEAPDDGRGAATP